MVGWGVLSMSMRGFASSVHSSSFQEPIAVHAARQADVAAPAVSADAAFSLISNLEKEIELQIRREAAQGSSLASLVVFQKKNFHLM